MRVLVIAEKRKQVKALVASLKEKGVFASYLRISKIVLVSKNNRNEAKALGKTLQHYDAVFLQARPSLAPFVEPLLELFAEQGTYCNIKPGSFFISFNEPYKFVNLALANVPAPKTLTSGSARNIELVSKKISYPLMAKSFLGKKIQQSLIINNAKELATFVKSIRSDVDGFMLREFIGGDVVSCVVAGQKVFAVKRKTTDQVVAEIQKGSSYRPTEAERLVAVNASQACGFDVARVDLAKGRVVKVEPVIPFEKFNASLPERIEANLASFIIEQAELHGKKTNVFDEFKEIANVVSKTIFGRLFR